MRIIMEVMKFPFHHRAFYCYFAMSLWIFFIITAMYKYISVDEETPLPRKAPLKQALSRTDMKFRRIYMKACNPPDNIVRGSEGVVDWEAWALAGSAAVTRHGDRGPLTHLRGGARLPCDAAPPDPLLKSYEEYVRNVSGGLPRGPWAAAPGPFHNFPSLPARAQPATRCPLGQLTPRGLLQMLRVGSILKEAYAEKLGLDVETPNSKKDTGDVILWSTRYRRTYQSLLGTLWALRGGAGSGRGGGGGVAKDGAGDVAVGVSNSGAGGGGTISKTEAGVVGGTLGVAGGGSGGGAAARDAAGTKESHSVHYCFRDCACAANDALNKKIKQQSKARLNAHPAIKELVNRISSVIFESEEKSDPEIVKDALLAYMCHEAPLPCTQQKTNNKKLSIDKYKKFRSRLTRTLKSDDALDIDYNQVDLNNDFGRKARDIINKYYDSKDKKSPLDFDAQMEREKLIYYQQKYLDNTDGYEDVVVVKKNLDADFNFPNDARADTDFDDFEATPESSDDDFCVKKEHVVSIFSYLEWSYKQEMRNIHSRRRGLLQAYGLIHNIVQNMIRMISEGKPKFILYSGHDKTLQPLVYALGLNDHRYSVNYASRMVFEVYRRKDLRDEFKFTKRKAEAQDFYFRVVFNGDDVTNRLSFCRPRQNVVMKVEDPVDDSRVFNTYLCPIENIVRFIHDDYFSVFNVSNYKDACASYKNGKIHF